MSAEARRWARLPGIVLAAAILGMAVAVRIPYLQLVPVISDEAFEVLAALAMLDGPFVWFGPFDPTTGPLVTWVLALAFRLLGPGPYVARAVTLLFGIATVGLTYALARSFAQKRVAGTGAVHRSARHSRAENTGPAPSETSPESHAPQDNPRRGLLAGTIAGLLLAFNPVHILVNSRIAWSNSATPLLVAAACLVLHTALRRRNGWLLVLGGFLAGLALQTHLSVLVVFPGLLIWFLARRDVLAWLRQPWPYLAAAAALLGYGNMIIYNVVSRGGALANVQLHTYAWEANPSLATYVQNTASLVTNTAATLAGQVPRVHDPLVWLAGGLLIAWLLAALVYATARGETMPVLVILSTTLIMPYFNKTYEGLSLQRYTAFLLPICFAAMGLLAADALLALWWRIRSTNSETSDRIDGFPLKRGVLLAAAMVIVLAALATYPVRNLAAHYAVETKAGRDNHVTLALTRYLEEALPEGTALYVSSQLKDKEEGGGYRFLRAVYYYLSVREVAHRVLDPPDLASALAAAPGQPAWLVLTQPDYDELTAAGVQLEIVTEAPALPNRAFVARTK